MITNVKIDLDEEKRRNISRNMFGSNKPVTRKELTGLVELFVDYIVQPEQFTKPAPEDHPDNPVTRISCAEPAEPNDASYMRGWNAVAKATRSIR